MLLPIGSSSELFTHPPPLFPTSRLYNIRPYHSKDKVRRRSHTHTHYCFTHNAKIMHGISWKSKRCFQEKREMQGIFVKVKNFSIATLESALFTSLAKQPGSKPRRKNIFRSCRCSDLVVESHGKFMEFSISARAGSLYGEMLQN